MKKPFLAASLQLILRQQNAVVGIDQSFASVSVKKHEETRILVEFQNNKDFCNHS